jgi:hypothetical protein
VAAVDENSEANDVGTTECGDRVESRANRSTRVQDVVDEDDGGVVNTGSWNIGRGCRPRRLLLDVVSVHRHIERSDLNVLRFNSRDDVGKTLGEEHAARGDAEEYKASSPTLRFDDFMTNTSQGPVDIGLGEDDTRHNTLPFRLTGRF